MSATNAWIREQLEDRRERGLLRSDQILTQSSEGWTDPTGRPFLNFASNDYLGFTRRPELREAAARTALDFGAGAGASRLVTGTRPVHAELEEAVARLKGYPAARLFGSGMMAATGVIPVAGFLGALLSMGYDGPVRAEPFNQPLNQMDNEAACAATLPAASTLARLKPHTSRSLAWTAIQRKSFN